MTDKHDTIALKSALARGETVRDLELTSEWGGAVRGRFDTSAQHVTMIFLARPAPVREVLEFIVPNVWKAPLEPKSWDRHAVLHRAQEHMVAKVVLAPDGAVHVALDVPTSTGTTLNVVVQRALTVLRRDLDSLRTACLLMLRSA